MEGVKWLENIAKQLNPAVSVKAADSLNTAFPCSLGRICGERCPSRSRRAAVEEPGMREGIGMCPGVHKPGVIAQAKLVETNPLMQFHQGFECQFLHSIFLLDKSKPFHRWWLAPAPCGSSWTRFKLYVVFSCKSFYPTSLPSVPLPTF